MRFNTHRLDRERLLKGWSKSTLAGKTGVNPSTISNVLAGKTSNVETLKKIADALGLEMEEIYIEEEEAKTA